MVLDLGSSFLSPSSAASDSIRSRTKSSSVHEFTRDPYDHEPSLKEGRKILYYKFCSYNSTITTNLRNHLKKHDIESDSRPNRTKEVALAQLTQLYAEAMELEAETNEIESMVLKKILKKDIL
jgi:hypothetical protein